MKHSIEAILLRVEVLIGYAKQNKKDMTEMSPDFYISQLENLFKNLKELEKNIDLSIKKNEELDIEKKR